MRIHKHCLWVIPRINSNCSWHITPPPTCCCGIRMELYEPIVFVFLDVSQAGVVGRVHWQRADNGVITRYILITISAVCNKRFYYKFLLCSRHSLPSSNISVFTPLFIFKRFQFNLPNPAPSSTLLFSPFFSSFNFRLLITSYRQQRSLGQGNIFTSVCHSVHRVGACMAGGVHGEGSMLGEGGEGQAWQERRPLQGAVRILLECILVTKARTFWTLSRVARLI